MGATMDRREILKTGGIGKPGSTPRTLACRKVDLGRGGEVFGASSLRKRGRENGGTTLYEKRGLSVFTTE